MQEKIIDAARKHWGVLIYAIFCTIGALLIVFYAQDIGLHIFDFMANRQDKRLTVFLDRERDSIVKNILLVSKQEDLRTAIENQDISAVQTLLGAAQKRTDIHAYTATDAHGVALSRIPFSANLGDNVFLTLPAGRLTSHGVTETIYGPGRNFPLTMAAGALITKPDGALLGAVFAGNWFNDDYAQVFKQKYLNGFRKQEVIFYSKEEGVIGDSLNDSTMKEKLYTYVSHASNLIQEGRSGDLINIKGVDYVITNHLLGDSEEVYGGILLLTPLPFTVFWRSFAASLFFSFLFFISLLLIERVTLPQFLRFKRRSFYLFLLLISFAVFLTLWTGIYANGRGIVMSLDKPLFAIYNSTMKIRPGSGVYAIGYPQQVAIAISSGGEDINAVEVRLHFDPKVINVDSLSFSRSMCTPETIIEQEINNTKGFVAISCAVMERPFSDTRGIVTDISMTPIATGDAALTFDEDSHVLAADGLGTDVLRSVSSGFYRVFDEKDMSDHFSTSTLLIPFSSTHENSSKWYKSNNVTVMWPKVEGAEYLYEFSENATTTFNNPKITQSNEVKITAPHDGIYYFKLAVKKGDAVGLLSRLQIKIDITAPDIPLIKVSNLSVEKDNVIRFELSSGDESSGLQKNFYIQVDDSVWLPTFSKLYMPFHDEGRHTVGVRVFDNAENYSDSEVMIRVKN